MLISGHNINHTGDVRGVLHTDRGLSPSKLSQASGPTAASLKWNLASNNKRVKGVSSQLQIKLQQRDCTDGSPSLFHFSSMAAAAGAGPV